MLTQLPSLRVALLVTPILVLGLTAPVHAQTTWHVDDDADPDGDGTTWITAFRFLQDALAVAVAGDEVRVAGGVYRPDEDGDDPNGSGDREATFQLLSAVALYGGYRGMDPNDPGDPNDQDPNAFEAILSGDLNCDDDPNDFPGGPSYSDNCYHVVTGSGTDETAVLDGFTITAGNANGSYPHKVGGGMYNDTGSPALANCTFSQNSAEWYGGGMYNDHASPSLANCGLSGNSAADDGGGMYNRDSSPRLAHCGFDGNWARTFGGGMCNDQSNPTLGNCTFNGNSVEYCGGGMYNIWFSEPTLANCTFSANTASEGAGMFNEWWSNPTLMDCSFSGNSTFSGGGMFGQYYSEPTLVDCTFTANSAASYGGGMCNWSFNCESTYATLINCTFSGNSAPIGGGMYNEHGDHRLINCTFRGNSADEGGGVYNHMYSGATTVTLINCTLSRNAATSHGGAMYCDHHTNSILANCILWGNTAPNGPEIYRRYDPIVSVTYSCIQDGWPGDGNIDEDPLFVDPGNDDYHLSSDSPCINAGSNYVPELPDADIEGNPRIQHCRVDIGAYESPHPGTFEDCNNNDVDDDCDIYEGVSQDCNQNHVPDECECVGDLDGDGVTDQSDLGILLADWGCDDPINGCDGDLNGDDKTDQSDLGILLADWGCGT